MAHYASRSGAAMPATANLTQRTKKRYGTLSHVKGWSSLHKCRNVGTKQNKAKQGKNRPEKERPEELVTILQPPATLVGDAEWSKVRDRKTAKHKEN